MIYTGIVENRQDPYKIGRCQVRIVGLHSDNVNELPTADLPWAVPISPINSAAFSGIGYSNTGPVEGTWVAIIFSDPDKQQPIMLGTLAGIPSNDQPNNQVEEIVRNGKLPKFFTSVSQDAVNLVKKVERFQRESYEIDGQLFIGYKSKTSAPGTVTREEAEQLLIADLKNNLQVVHSTVKAIVTESMVSAMLSIIQDVGEDAWKVSSVLKDVNASKYNIAAAEIAKFNDGTDRNIKRRVLEQQLFLKDALPTTTVIQAVASSSNAFSHGPKVVLNEPDTNRLARHENIENTIVPAKEAARDTNVEIANGKGSWSQSQVPYNADFPFNHVYSTESGHVLEFDDTEHSERIHLYHRTGTFTEIDANGTQVNRIVGDSFEILERNGYVHIKGASHVNVEGANTLKVSGTMDVEVNGQCTVNINNDAKINVSGNADLAVDNSFNVIASSINLEATGDLNVKAGKLNISSDSTLDILTAGVLNVGYQIGNFGSGATGATSSGLSKPGNRKGGVSPSFSPLSVLTREFRISSQYETPEDGDGLSFRRQRVENDSITVEELDQGDKVEETPIERNSVSVPGSNCDAIFASTNIPIDFKLSNRYTLKDLTKQGSRPIVSQFGLTKQQIVCNLKGLCENCLDAIKDRYPNVTITSGFRRPGDVANSATKSQHYLGEAADLYFVGFSRKDVYEAAIAISGLIPFDQLILEYSGKDTVWIHVSFKYENARKQILTMRDHKVVGSKKFVLIT